MATTPKLGFRYPVASDAPDGPGGIYNLASDLDNFLAQGAWAPGLGGTGASVGTGTTGGGHYLRIGQQVRLTGKITFGAGTISFGTGTPTIVNIPYNLIVSDAVGSGWFIPASGAAPAAVGLLPVTASTMAIRIITSGSSASATTITPAQSDQVLFTIDGTAM